MSYTESIQCRLLASQCCCCGRPLVDAISVQLGIGPECRGGFDGGIRPEIQDECNRLTYLAAIAAQEGKIEEVREIADLIQAMGLPTLAEKIARRFVNAERNVKITIEVRDGDMLAVKTPFRRGKKAEFIEAWRRIPGRRYSAGVNLVPVTQREALWTLLREFFPGDFARGPKGIFRIIPLPTATATV